MTTTKSIVTNSPKIRTYLYLDSFNYMLPCTLANKLLLQQRNIHHLESQKFPGHITELHIYTDSDLRAFPQDLIPRLVPVPGNAESPRTCHLFRELVDEAGATLL